MRSDGEPHSIQTEDRHWQLHREEEENSGLCEAAEHLRTGLWPVHLHVFEEPVCRRTLQPQPVCRSKPGRQMFVGPKLRTAGAQSSVYFHSGIPGSRNASAPGRLRTAAGACRCHRSNGSGHTSSCFMVSVHLADHL